MQPRSKQEPWLILRKIGQRWKCRTRERQKNPLEEDKGDINIEQKKFDGAVPKMKGCYFDIGSN